MSLTLATTPLVVDNEQRRELERIARSSSMPPPDRRAGPGTAAGGRRGGDPRDRTASRRPLELDPDLVLALRERRRRRRGRECTRPRPQVVAPRPEGTVAAVVHDTLHALPDDGSTHWATRTMAARHGIGKDSVARIWRNHGLKPGSSNASGSRTTRLSRRNSSTWSDST
ncbi:MAG: hypothetical protein ACLP1E_15455 [Acidimicrobiales bacterium]